MTTVPPGEWIRVSHAGQQIIVPKTFKRRHIAARFGPVPDVFKVDRIFTLDDNVHVESYLGRGEWVEAIFQTKESAPVFNASELGWVATLVERPPVTGDGSDRPGETLWLRSDSEGEK